MFLEMFRTAFFLVSICCCSFYWCHGCLEEERTLLLQIKDSINYPAGSSLDEAWITKKCCHWPRVKCKASSFRVTSIDLSRLRDGSLGLWSPNISLFAAFKELEKLDLGGNNIGGWVMPQGLRELKNFRGLNLDSNNLNGRALAPFLSNLSMLEDLSLWDNELESYSSALTGICELTTLRSLDLGGNRLNDYNIPKCLGNLSLLEELYLWDNKLKSPFSSLTGFCELRNLQYLDVTKNSYVGSIPQCFGNMNSLREIHLSYNQFTGTIPPSIFQNLTNLMIISTSHNQFNDSISFSKFANLSKLVHIDLSDNVRFEVETEHPHWVPTFHLQSLFLSNCILNKRGGSGIPTFISTQKSLETLDLSHSSLKGTIPSWLLNNLTVRSLILGGNSLKGPFPQSTQRNNSMLKELDVSDNNFFGELPSNIDTLFPDLIVFNMSKNELQGTIPVSISKLEMLGMLDLSQNNLSGEMPHGLISRNSTWSASPEYLRLSNNKLQGNILSKFSDMTELVVLLLDNNGFTGTIASNMLSSPSLKILDLSNNNLSGFIPSWLPLLTNLAILHLDGNFFNGPIPSEVCQMQNLHILDLSNNKISGSIPSCLPNISSWMKEISIEFDISSVFSRVLYSINGTYVSPLQARVTAILTTKGMTLTYEGRPLSLMTIIDLSMNNLTGNIPSQMGKLKALHSLNLSNNILSGPIPKSFQNLESIESLDLSHNKIVGTIPPQMVQLYKLSTFNVSFNKLSGAIPNEKQFPTFNESSYIANPHLCGPPLQRSCSCNNSSQSRDNKGEEEDDDSTILDSPLFFYLWVAISYILGFWGFLALFANKNWRWKFFSTVDRCFDSSYLNLHMFRLYLKNICCN